MRLTIDQFALECSEAFDMTKKEAREHIEGLFEVIAENVAAGHEINIPGFGKFKRHDKPARVARNPHTGEKMDVPAKSVPKFLPAKAFKEVCDA